MFKVSFITKDKKFQEIISSLRRMNYDAIKGSVDTDFSTFKVIIVDLDYPLEKAYPLLEKIRLDYQFSDKIIIAVVSYKQQISKLRSMALGCDAYISSSISASDLAIKIREIDNPEKNLLKKKLYDAEIDIQIEASMSHISENGCIIKSKIAFNEDEREIDLESALIDEIELESRILYQIFRSFPTAKRNFVTQLHFQNLNESDRCKIRKVIHSWSVK